jgi:hypothetical protein
MERTIAPGSVDEMYDVHIVGHVQNGPASDNEIMLSSTPLENSCGATPKIPNPKQVGRVGNRLNGDPLSTSVDERGIHDISVQSNIYIIVKKYPCQFEVDPALSHSSHYVMRDQSDI